MRLGCRACPRPAIPGLISSKDPGFYLQSEYGTNPYITFNTVSPNNGGALAKAAVRQALMYAFDRTALIQDNGGPNVAPPLTHILPPGINGSTPDYDPYPYNPTKAKQLLAARPAPRTCRSSSCTGRPSRPAPACSRPSRPSWAPSASTSPVCGVPNSDFYTKYLEVPSVAKSGGWDLSLTGWGPDWYGDAAKSFFLPLFDGRTLPPQSSNFGLFNDPNLTPIINNALARHQHLAGGHLLAPGRRRGHEPGRDLPDHRPQLAR